ncbi:hypothetical protein Dsin_012253 [Dipteronia sinensis]|uniref:Reverse transcriptase domain-containing protein n=1 Tax=Dipteronia sinensis TaxID=43782 RepID=A0AAE0AI58_9ROSI|nr:hypothetical protein Dsin_012253 [Dipteronia sinensis]
MTLKLDMSKTYDKVKCAFLSAVMSKINFSALWIELVSNCISSSRLSFMLNGPVVCSVSPSRGLRHGCLISPYFFLLWVEAFSGLISSSERNGQVLSIRGCRGSPFFSHSFFTNDGILFCNASKVSYDWIQNLLATYEKGSGQQINLQKSKLTFSRRKIQCLLVINDCNMKDNYLGLLTVVRRNKRKIFNEIKERVENKLWSWKSSMFSYGG